MEFAMNFPWLGKVVRRTRFPRASQRRRRFARPAVEQLEGRLLLATYRVCPAADAARDAIAGLPPEVGCNTFGGAIRAANDRENVGGRDRIVFSGFPPGTGPVQFGGGHVITDPVEIDGTTHPDYTPDTPMIEVGAGELNQPLAAIEIRSGGSEIRGLVFNSESTHRFGFSGIVLTGRGGNVIQGNIIGLDATGTFAPHPPIARDCYYWPGPFPDYSGVTRLPGPFPDLTLYPDIRQDEQYTGEFHFLGPCTLSIGIHLLGSSDNIIGGPNPGDRNVISGNSYGIVIDGSNRNRIQGSYFGAQSDGLTPVPNGAGIVIHSGSMNTIGVINEASERNVFFGNVTDHIHIEGVSTSNHIAGNYIGVTATGIAPAPSPDDPEVIGVHLDGPDVERNLIGVCPIEPACVFVGGTGSYENSELYRNVISRNIVGVHISGGASENTVAGNFIGTDRAAATDTLLGNGIGIFIKDSPSNIIGGTTGLSTDRCAGDCNVISGNATGVKIEGVMAERNRVVGNFIGTTADRQARLPNHGDGIEIAGAPSNTIGGTLESGFNIFAGNEGRGIRIGGQAATGNVVQGNYIGTNPAGSPSLPNDEDGILINGAPANFIGGGSFETRNVIAGNAQNGIWITGVDASFNHIRGNQIGNVGMNVDGQGFVTTRLPNGEHGIFINSGRGNTIGGSDLPVGSLCLDTCNVISGNTKHGVVIQGTDTTENRVIGNFMGLDLEGKVAVPNGDSSTSAGEVADGRGVVISDSANNTIGAAGETGGNLISGNEVGIDIRGADSKQNQVLGNRIGFDSTGTAVLPTTVGIWVDSAASQNSIGGTAEHSGNVIGGGKVGIWLFGDLNQVQGNFIGTTRHDRANLGTSLAGIWIATEGSQNTVGGSTEAVRNIISGNSGRGVLVDGDNNMIQGNYIGADSSGKEPLPNKVGISIYGKNNTIGGPRPMMDAECSGTCNLISGNTGAGIEISVGLDQIDQGNRILGNFIGMDVTGQDVLRNLGDGVRLDFAHTNVIGEPGAGNLISGNVGHNIAIVGGSSQNVLQANFIGPQRDGATRIARELGGTGEDSSGVYIEDSPSNIIGQPDGGNVISGNREAGITITGTGSTNNRIQSNKIGTTLDGNQALPNGQRINMFDGDGVQIFQGASNNVVGGNTTAQRNIISGNEDNGIAIYGAGSNFVQGNIIGLGADGRSPIPNESSVSLVDAPFTVIGGGVSQRNYISGNGHGVAIITSDLVRVADNFIGTDVDGKVGMGNGLFGLIIDSGSQNTIERNVISANDGAGVTITAIRVPFNGNANVLRGNFIGTQADGKTPLGNRDHGVELAGVTSPLEVRGTQIIDNVIAFNGGAGVFIDDGFGTIVDTRVGLNIIHRNVGPHILHGPRAVPSPPPAGPPPDPGPPTLQPIAIYNQTTNVPGEEKTVFEGVIESEPDEEITIDVYAGEVLHPAGSAQAEVIVEKDDEDIVQQGGIIWFRISFLNPLQLGTFVSFTATPAQRNTSVFSAGLAVGPAPPPDEISISDASITEGDTGNAVLELTLTRRNMRQSLVTVQVDTADGAATAADNDYVPVTGLGVSFPPGVLTQKIQVNVVGDLADEPNETFEVRLSNPTGGATLGQAVATATITNDDSNAISIGDAIVTEGNMGTMALQFTVSLANPTGRPVTIEVNTLDGSATAADGDYTPVAGLVLTFNPGDPLMQSVVVDVAGDMKVESDELLSVVLSNPTGPNVVIADDTGVGTVRNDDATAFSIGDAAVLEDSLAATFLNLVVSLSNPSDQTVSVDVAAVDGTATAASADYGSFPVQTLTFNPGDPLTQTVTLNVAPDSTVEPDEMFTVQLSNAVGANVAIADPVAAVTILNDDSTEITIGNLRRTEGTGGTTVFDVLVSLTNPVVQTVTVEVNTVDGAATAPDGDYTPIVGQVMVFSPGGLLNQFVVVNVAADDKMEANESFTVRLSNATGPNVSIMRPIGLFEILNDDISTFSVNDLLRPEGDGGSTPFTFTVNQSNPADRPLTVRLDTSDGSARVADGDYQPITNLILSYSPGDPLTRMVTVNVNGDLATEPDQTFRVVLSNPTGGAVASTSGGLGTISNDDPDSDGDGVSDKFEDLGPVGGDANQDATPDRLQSGVATVPNAVDGQYVTLVASPGTTLSGVRAVVNPDPVNSPPGVAFPVGFFEFGLAVPSPGDPATVTLLLPPAVVPDTFFKFGRQSPLEPMASFYEFLFDGATGAEIFADRIVLHLIDGGRGDNDLAADGTITEPGGVGVITGVDLSVIVSDMPDPVGQNQPLRYTLTVSNSGMNDATGVTLLNTLPPGARFVAAESSHGTFTAAGDLLAFQLGNLPIGSAVTVLLDVLAPPGAGIATNSAFVQADQVEMNPADNTARTDTLVQIVATITGQKFQDQNGNGRRDAGEIGLNGFTIELVDDATGPVVMTTTTRPIDLNGDGVIDPETERGRYEFAVLVAGLFEIRERSQAGFTQTFPAGAGAPITERVSVSDAAMEGNNSSFNPSISADGRFVAFESFSENLVPNDTNGESDVFVFDRQMRTIERVSVPDPRVGQAEANGRSFNPTISADGRFVAFASFASNLILGDTNFVSDIFVHDRTTGTTERMSEDANGIGGNFLSGVTEFGDQIGISGDGRFVAFTSTAENLVVPDPNATEVFVKDRQTGEIERISSGPTYMFGPAMSADGRWVAVAFPDDLAVFDRQTRTLDFIPTNFMFNPTLPSLSADGRFVAFAADAGDLVPGDSNGLRDVFVFDRQTRTTERVSVDSNGNQTTTGNGSYAPSISADGRFVAFVSDAADLVPGDTNSDEDVFVYDRQAGTIERVSVDSAGNQASGGAPLFVLFTLATSISGDGRTVAFDSDFVNLVPGDANSVTDVFVRGPGPASPRHRVTVVPGDAVTGFDFGNAGAFTNDFGDAPDSYGTREASDGARHAIGGPTLGTVAEPDVDGQPGNDATRDDRDGIDDEDGVVFASPLVEGEIAEFVVSASAPARLDAWVDFDGDATFDHPAEQILASRSLLAGDNMLQFVIPATAQPGRTFARFRASTAGGLLPTGLAPDGEVEDYAVEIQQPPRADLAITMTAGTAIAGESLTYTVTVENRGPSHADDVIVTAILPPGVPFVVTAGCTGDPIGVPECALRTIAAGASKQYAIVVQVPSSLTGEIQNVARVRSSTPDPNPGNEETAIETTVTTRADLAIAMSSSVAATAPGGQVTFTLNVNNRGPSDARDVVVRNVLPPGMTLVATSGCAQDPVGIPACTLGTLAAGDTSQVTIIARVSDGFLGTLTNRATVESSTPEAAIGDEAAQIDVQVVPPVDLVVSIHDDADPVVAGSNLYFTAPMEDGVLALQPLGPVIRDSLVIYTITVRNDGPSDAEDVVVTHAIPTGLTALGTDGCEDDALFVATCSLGTIPAGGSMAYRLIGQVAPELLGLIIVEAAVRTSTPETILTDNTASEQTQVIEHADLAITVSDDMDPVPAGSLVTYTVTVINRGPSAARDVVVTEMLPPDATLVTTSGCVAEIPSIPACSLGTIAATRSRQFTLTVRMGTHTDGLVSSSVAIASSTAEANPGSESASEETTVIVPSGDDVPILWGVDDDDGELFSIADYTKIGDGAAAAGFVSYGRLKYDQTGGRSLRDVGPHIEAFDLTADGTAYLGLSTALDLAGRPDLSPPVILKLNVHAATPAGPNVVDVVGRVRIKYRTGDNISGLAVHPQTGQLFILHRAGSARHVDQLVVVSPANASIIAKPRKIQSKALGLKCDQCEDLNFDASGRLYVTDDFDDDVYEINPATGEILAVIDGNEIGGLTGIGSSPKIESLAWADRAEHFVGFDDNSNQFLVLTPGTGNNATLGKLGGLTDVEGIDFLARASLTDIAAQVNDSRPTTGAARSVVVRADNSARDMRIGAPASRRRNRHDSPGFDTWDHVIASLPFVD
jgi:uncharacterized repeat protein (TIGR01451 family)